MTARYRCPFCGSYTCMGHLKMQQHFMDKHPTKLLEMVRKAGFVHIEAFGTRKDPNAPPRRLKDHLQSNPGVSGEGDS